MSNGLTDFLIRMMIIKYLVISIKLRISLHLNGIIYGADCFSDSDELIAVTFQFLSEMFTYSLSLV